MDIVDEMTQEALQNKWTLSMLGSMETMKQQKIPKPRILEFDNRKVSVKMSYDEFPIGDFWHLSIAREPNSDPLPEETISKIVEKFLGKEGVVALPALQKSGQVRQFLMKVEKNE